MEVQVQVGRSFHPLHSQELHTLVVTSARALVGVFWTPTVVPLSDLNPYRELLVLLDLLIEPNNPTTLCQLWWNSSLKLPDRTSSSQISQTWNVDCWSSHERPPERNSFPQVLPIRP